MLPTDLDKIREIVFHDLPHDQAARARELLDGLDCIQASIKIENGNTLTVQYKVTHYTLQGLEKALESQGFHLDNSLLQRIKRALIHFCENVQRENLAINAPDAKSQQVFARVNEQHLHGDNDETPEEWREYK
jgi:Fe-S cluster assembly iron-binding protein IscA